MIHTFFILKYIWMNSSSNQLSKSSNISESFSIINISFKSAFALFDCILELLLGMRPYLETFSNAFISSAVNTVLIFFSISVIFFIYFSLFFLSFCSLDFNKTWVDFNSFLYQFQSIYLSTWCNLRPFEINFSTWQWQHLNPFENLFGCCGEFAHLIDSFDRLLILVLSLQRSVNLH